MTELSPVRVQEVAPQIYQVRLPLPFALNHVNCYLLDDGDGWTILDTGLHWPAAEAGWQAALDELHLTPQAIRRIVLTHMHPDHFSMAGYLQQQTGAPIFVGEVERAAIERVWVQESWRDAAAVDFWRGAGLDAPLLQTVTEQVTTLRQRTLPHPANFLTIDVGQSLDMASRCFQPILAPGHSDGQLIFYSASDQLLLCGDQVLEKITPNIGLWPGNASTPLQTYLASLTELHSLTVRLALPGHGRSLTAWPTRIAALQSHHSDRLAAMLTAVAAHTDRDNRGMPCTALDVARALFNFQRFSEHEIRFAVAETLAHLVHLVDQRKLNEEIYNGVRHYWLP